MLSDILSRHRGPYLLMLTRPTTSKYKGETPRFCSEWLKSEVASEDVGDEARALLTDPRDCIKSVSVWSQKENMFVAGIRSEKDL